MGRPGARPGTLYAPATVKAHVAEGQIDEPRRGSVAPPMFKRSQLSIWINGPTSSSLVE